MADQLQRVFVLIGDDRNLGVGIDDVGQVAHDAIDADRQRRLGQAESDIGGEFGAGQGRVVRPDAAVGERDGGHESLLSLA